MIKRLSKLFNKQLEQKDKHYKKIINELVVSNKRKDDQIEILCETIRILNQNKPQIIEKTIIRERTIEIRGRSEEKQEPEEEIVVKTDKYTKPINDFGEIKSIPKSADLRNMRDRITQDSVRMSVNKETKDNIIDMGFKNRHEYLYFKIKLSVKGRMVLKK